MSLYYEASRFLDSPSQGSSLKSRVYATKDLKSSAAQIHGLCIEATRWSPVLADIVEKAGILETERKLTPALALLLTYDLLLGKRISARKDHILSLAINRHKARLSAEFTRARIRSGQPNIDAWRRALLENEKLAVGDERSFHPRWVRVNTLLSTADAECTEATGVFYGWRQVHSLTDLLEGSDAKRYYIDEHIPSLIATPPGSETYLTKTPAYKGGRIILQDKASCFPAYLLFSAPCIGTPPATAVINDTALRSHQKGDIIDACAAPGNKTTHLAALAMNAHSTSTDRVTGRRPNIVAVERDKTRALTLAQMVKTAGADKDGLVTCLQGQDFSRLNPEDKKWTNVTALLLDPSCSGSGIVGRDQGDDENSEGAGKLILPIPAAHRPSGTDGRSKHKKKTTAGEKNGSKPSDAGQSKDSEAENEPDKGAAGPQDAELQKRLQGLQGFQLSLLTHAFRFPAARKVVYSTCSIHAEENEQVVFRALHSKVAKERGWRIMTRAEQIDGMRRWHVRGVVDAFEQLQPSSVVHDDQLLTTSKLLADACIRCEKGTADGTMGFFAVGFVRSNPSSDGMQDSNDDDYRDVPTADVEQKEEDSFEGFDD